MKIFQEWGLDFKGYTVNQKLKAFLYFCGIILVSVLLTSGDRIVNFLNYYENIRFYLDNTRDFQMWMFALYAFLNLSLMIYSYYKAKMIHENLYWVATAAAVGMGAIAVLMMLFVLDILTITLMGVRLHFTFISFSQAFIAYLSRYYIVYYFPVLLFFLSFTIRMIYLKTTRYNSNRDIEKTSKRFGSAQFADEKDLNAMGAYDSQGIVFGRDFNGKLLRVPISNRTIVSYSGGGKTVSLIIPTLLTENRPMLIHDIKGELWAVTATYRSAFFKRTVIAIDPFGVLEEDAFQKGKMPELLQRFKLNPLDLIPENPKYHDRAITALAASMVVHEKNASSNHWEDNAKLLLGGLIDYVVTNTEIEPENKNLLTIHDLLARNKEDCEELMQRMYESDSKRASAAAANIMKAGPDERGSIYTTTYRQVKWLAESNLRDMFSVTNFPMQEFINGQMDIYVVIPEDQVFEQSRVIRMIFSLITTMLLQVSPDKIAGLKKLGMLIMFDELGQLEYNEDVEKAIEVLRARGVYIWAVFQTLSQINLYKKPDLFTNAKVKHFFNNDDTDTMEYIARLGGEQTITVENVSTNTGKSTNAGQSTKSEGTSSSIQETGVNMIPMNEIREQSSDEQFVFIKGKKAIKCKKINYYSDQEFKGKFDNNPLESTQVD